MMPKNPAPVRNRVSDMVHRGEQPLCFFAPPAISAVSHAAFLTVSIRCTASDTGA